MTTNEWDVSCNEFNEQILNTTVYFKLIYLDNSILVWIGTAPLLNNLSVGLPLSNGEVRSTKILAQSSDILSLKLSERLAKKTKKQIFVSTEIQTENEQLTSAIEARLFQEINR